MESKTLRMGERLSMRKKLVQMNSMWIPIGAYKMYSTANDMSEWKLKKKIQFAKNFKGGGTHENMTSNNKKIYFSVT